MLEWTKVLIPVLPQDDDVDQATGQAYAASTMSTNGSISRPRAKSVASVKLKEQGLDEIIPIQHMNSSNTKVVGSHVVEEPGNYVLVFGK